MLLRLPLDQVQRLQHCGIEARSTDRKVEADKKRACQPPELLPFIFPIYHSSSFAVTWRMCQVLIKKERLVPSLFQGLVYTVDESERAGELERVEYLLAALVGLHEPDRTQHGEML